MASQNKSEYGISSYNESGTFQGAQVNLFSNRDEGLACFNLLDHLKTTGNQQKTNNNINSSGKSGGERNQSASAQTP